MDELSEADRFYREFLSPDLARLLKISGYGVLEIEAEGSIVRCSNGKKTIEFLDFAAGYGVFNLGHRHPEVVDAVHQQLDRMPLSAKVFLNPVMARLAKELAAIAPGRLQYSFCCNSGTEAVEGALKLARLVTGRFEFVATDNAFHGKTIAALSVSGRPTYREPFGPLLMGVCHVPFGDLDAMKAVISEHVAAVILEPVQGEGGIHVAPDGYLQGVRDLCDSYGALLIIDEVQTGFGRTGKMFACEHWGIEPDIMTFAKALGGGVMPIGCFMATPEVWKVWTGRPTLHTSTFGGNPLACVAALATLRVLTRDNLPQQATDKGKTLINGLRGIARRYPDIIREVRGLGLLIGVELAEERFGGAIIMEMARQRVIAVYTMNQPRVIRFEPPLIVSDGEMDRALEAFETAVRKTREMFFKS